VVLTTKETMTLKPHPSISSQNRNVQVVYFFLLILFVSVLTSVILVVIFSRDSPDAELITRLSWETPAVLRKRLKFLPKTNHLLSIWTDPDPVSPEDLIKGGTSVYDAFRADWDALGYTSERGIVMAAGGFHYFASAYVLVRELRHQGCKLPIEMWYRAGEMGRQHIQYLRTFGVICLNIDHYLPFNMQHKFAIKVIAMYLSAFREILFLDADNNVVMDPTFLFDCPEYKKHEVLFWPDFWPLGGDAPCYESFPEGVKPQLNPFQQESGQMVVNKQRYWRQLWFVFRILENNLETLFPTPFNFGDKDLFHITWNATDQPFTFVKHRTGAVATYFSNVSRKQIKAVAMAQHAPDGRVLFVHQNHAEWGDRRGDDTAPWWVHLKRHTHTTRGGVEGGYWNPIGPTKVEAFRDQVGTMEDDYVKFMDDLRAERWYRDFYVNELNDRSL